MKKYPSPKARREFLKLSAGAAGAAGLLSSLPVGSAQAAEHSSGGHASTERDPAETADCTTSDRRYASTYSGTRLDRIAFPMGGIGAGMICLEGKGALSHVSIRNHPDVYNEPSLFAALSILGSHPVARVLEGQVPKWKLLGMKEAGLGGEGTTYGLPRLENAEFAARFPFGTVSLSDPVMPVTVELTGWSPFTPGDADSSSLPVAGLEYQFTNPTTQSIDAAFSLNASNFMTLSDTPPDSNSVDAPNAVKPIDGGFVLWGAASKEQPWGEASFAVTTDDPSAKVNYLWFRGGWFDAISMAWNDVVAGACFNRPPAQSGDPSPGATLFVPLQLAPGASHTVRLRLAWYAPKSNIQFGSMGDPKGKKKDPNVPTYQPWYAGKFPDIDAVAKFWGDHYADLRARTAKFSAAFYDSTLPPEVTEAIAANLAILKSPTVMRQTDGRFWAWEGSADEVGSCEGSCTHVWNYAQAVPHLFPELERSLRETEFGPNQDAAGHQQFRAALPIRPIGNFFHAAADGQLGGVMKIHRDWLISGDTEWLRGMWPKVRKSLDYCIETWDPQHKGWLEEPHHNTYDIEFWGPDGMCTSIYLGALQAAVTMGRALNDDVSGYGALLEKGRARSESELFNGEYFIQKIEWKNLRAKNPADYRSMGGSYSPEARALLEKEGPKYQYGNGCLSDGVLGAWFALVCGVGQVLDKDKVQSHLRAVHQYNLKKSLLDHANPQRPGYAIGAEGGLLLCSWPRGGALSLPFVYSDEVWTGIEYQVASHLMFMGMVEEGLEVVRTCRNRYDGNVRNPFDEYECGHWYARAMASYGMLQGLSGARYDAVAKVLYLKPSLKGDFRCFLSTATGFGTVGVKAGKPFLEVASGTIPYKKIEYTAA